MSWPWSKTLTTFGCASRAAERASWMKRSRNCAVVGEVAVHDLDGDAALEAQVGGEVDGRHAAAGDARAHLVPAVEETADHRVGWLLTLTRRV